METHEIPWKAMRSHGTYEDVWGSMVVSWGSHGSGKPMGSDENPSGYESFKRKSLWMLMLYVIHISPIALQYINSLQ